MSRSTLRPAPASCALIALALLCQSCMWIGMIGPKHIGEAQVQVQPTEPRPTIEWNFRYEDGEESTLNPKEYAELVRVYRCPGSCPDPSEFVGVGGFGLFKGPVVHRDEELARQHEQLAELGLERVWEVHARDTFHSKSRGAIASPLPYGAEEFVAAEERDHNWTEQGVPRPPKPLEPGAYLIFVASQDVASFEKYYASGWGSFEHAVVPEEEAAARGEGESSRPPRPASAASR